MKRAVLIAAAVSGAWLFVGSAAHAASVTSAILGSGMGCRDAGCFDVSLLLQGSPALTGDLDVDPTALLVDFDMTLALATFMPMGGSDNGVTSLQFQNVRYQGAASLVLEGSSWRITGGSANISGAAVPSGAGSPTAINVTTAISGSCQIGASAATCGIIFSSDQFAVQVNGQTRYFSNTANVSAPVPEAAGGGLVGLALGALGLLRSRRS